MPVEQSYIYNLEFSIENVKIFETPPELECPDDLDFLIRFQMNPDICLEVTEDEYIDTINCGEIAKKKTIFTLSDKQLECDPKATITAYKIKCPKDLVPCGCYSLCNLNCKFQELRKKFDCENKCGGTKKPTNDVIKELVVIHDCDGKLTGSIQFILKISCLGPSINCDANFLAICEKYKTELDEFGRMKGCKVKTKEAEDECVAACPNDDQSEYDEFMAQVNGNQLILRVTKDNFVTRVFDASCKESKDKLTIRGCNQQLDFKFPKKFTCCQCKKKFGNCKCKGDSDLTDYQHKTSCSGSSYKNSRALPVIRGNLKYPGRFEDQPVNFDLQNHCKPIDATEKYKMKPQETRAACVQAENDNFNKETGAMPKGIECCRVGCEDDVDVFVWKICQKKSSRDGKKSEIELEMRTPRGPNVDIPRKETREVQVFEEEFEEMKKIAKKEVHGLKAAAPSTKNGKTNGREIPKNVGNNSKVPTKAGNAVKKDAGNSKSEPMSKTTGACQKKKPVCK